MERILTAILGHLHDFATSRLLHSSGAMAQSSMIRTSTRLQLRQEVAQSSIGPCQGQFAQQGSGPQIESRVAVATGFRCKGRCEKALAHAGRTEHENVLAVADLGRVFCDSTHYRLVQARAAP